MSDAHTAVEAGIPIVIGTTLLLGLVVGVPTWLAYWLLSEGRWVMAAAVAFVEGATIWVIVRDIRRRKAGALTWMIGAAWVIAIVYVAFGLYFE